LAGQRLGVLFSKQRAGRLVFVCEGGSVGSVTLPKDWTDRGPQPGRGRLTVEGLIALDTLRKAWVVVH